MKRIFTILTLAIIGTYGCKNSIKKSGPDFPSRIEFKETTFNFGIVPNGSEQNCTFEFLNTSEVPLVINNVIASCGCTNPTWPKKPVKPGQRAKIQVKYLPAGEGKFFKTISVFSNAKNSPVHLNITGVIKL